MWYQQLVITVPADSWYAKFMDFKIMFMKKEDIVSWFSATDCIQWHEL